MLLHALASFLLFVSPPAPAAEAALPTQEVTPALEGSHGSEQQPPTGAGADLPEEMDDADLAELSKMLNTMSPGQAAAIEAISTIDPALMERFDAMSDEQLDALMSKRASGQTLSEEERALTEANITIAVAGFEAEIDYQNGDIELGEGLATLHLGQDYRYLSPQDTQRVLTEAWGNPPGELSLGMIVPNDVSVVHPFDGWGVSISYAQDGHVSDEDANDIDYDELLENMQAGTQEANKARIAGGYTPMHLVGWAEAPHYDAKIKSMYWALEYRDDDDASPNSLNYAIRVLGRKGVLELNAISFMDQMPLIKPAMEEVYSRVEFKQGNRYDDFNPDVDQVAAYTLGGLIAGGVVAKSGLLKVLLGILIAGKKFFVLIAVGIGAFFMKFVGRKEEKE